MLRRAQLQDLCAPRQRRHGLAARRGGKPAARAPGISRPFARNLLYSDQVTLACRIERNGGDWVRKYLMAEGDEPIEKLVDRPEKEWLGIEHWRKRLEGAGLSRAIARVLALEQGQTDRLCEYSPKELLRLVFDVFGDQEVLDRYEEARQHQRQLAEEVEAAERDLAHGQAQLAYLDGRVNLYRQHQAKLRERETLATEVVPVLAWAEERLDIAARLRELHRQRVHHAVEARQRRDYRHKLRPSRRSATKLPIACASWNRTRAARRPRSSRPATPNARWRNWSSAPTNCRRWPRLRGTQRSSPSGCASWRNANRSCRRNGTNSPRNAAPPRRRWTGCRGSDRRRRHLRWRVSCACCARRTSPTT